MKGPCMQPQDWAGELPGQFYIETKIDGVRALWLGGQDLRLISKNAGTIDGTRDLAIPLTALEASMGGRWMFDGELVAGADFEETNANVRAGRLQSAVLHVFDAVPLQDWRRGGTATPYDVRRNLLEDAWARLVGARTPPINHAGIAINLLQRVGPFEDGVDVDRMFERVKAAGGEGIVIKSANGPYITGASYGWWRRKVRQTADCRILSADMGAGGRLRGLTVDHLGKAVSVTSGFSDAERLRIAEHGPPCSVAEIAHLGITSGGSLRSPSFLRFRTDKEA